MDMDGAIDVLKKVLIVAIPAIIGGIVTVTSNPRLDTTIMVWGLAALFAAGALWGIGARRHRVESSKAQKDRDDEIMRMFEEIRKADLNLQKMTCRLCIYDPHFDLDEKVEAYKLYAAHGWNHQAKHHMDELVGEDVDDWLAKRGRLHDKDAGSSD